MRAVAFAVSASCTLVFASLASSAAMPSIQEPPLRAATLVELSAVVSREGQPVTDLQASEVEVLDNGVPQPIVAFEHVDTITGDKPEQPGDFVLVLDDIGTAPEDASAAITVGLTLADALGPHDRLAIVNTGPFPLVQQLSTDRAAARRLIRQFLGQRGKSTTSLSAGQVCRQTVVMLRVVENALKAAAHPPVERAAILVVGEGHRVYWADAGRPKCSQARAVFGRIIAASAATNVPIYGVDVRGPQNPAPQLSGASGPQAAAKHETSMVETAAGRRTGMPYGSLENMATATGGTLTAARNDLASGVHQLVRDSRQYYRIAYAQPEVPKRDRDKPRRLEVRVRRGGVEVRARQRYLAH
jgi:VWFA-related protein